MPTPAPSSAPALARSGLGRLWQAWRAVWPSRCAICRDWPARPLCEACVLRFAAPEPRCTSCALPVTTGVWRCMACVQQPAPLERCVAAVHYGWPWRERIAALKFQAQPGWAEPLAWVMRSAPGAEDLLAQTDVLVPMPLSTQRWAERGYNQSALLAQALCPTRTRTDLLLRVRHTTPQAGLTRAQRLHNLRQSMVVAPAQEAALRGCQVLLIDDVMTTGASLYEAAQVLRRAGAAAVSALVLARAPLDQDETA